MYSVYVLDAKNVMKLRKLYQALLTVKPYWNINTKLQFI